MYVHVYTHTEDHFPLSRLKLHPPQHTGPCHRGHTGDTRGTCWGRTGDTWGTCLSAELRSGTHKHAGGGPPSPSPLRASGHPWSWCPGHTGSATLTVWHWGSPSTVPAVPWVTSSPASSCVHQRVHMYGCHSDTGGGLWLSPRVIADIHTCGCGHIQGWQCLCPHTRLSVLIHVCSHSHTHTEPWLYTRVAGLAHTCGHLHTRAWLFSC